LLHITISLIYKQIIVNLLTNPRKIVYHSSQAWGYCLKLKATVHHRTFLIVGHFQWIQHLSSILPEVLTSRCWFAPKLMSHYHSMQIISTFWFQIKVLSFYLRIFMKLNRNFTQPMNT
jgi:hypothetical protein